jgi:hypothetical protein
MRRIPSPDGANRQQRSQGVSHYTELSDARSGGNLTCSSIGPFYMDLASLNRLESAFGLTQTGGHLMYSSTPVTVRGWCASGNKLEWETS